MFVGLHAMAAQILGAEEVAITPDEGAAFMKSAQNVMRHYSVQSTQKTLDWVAFAGVSAGLYLPRLAAVNIRRRNEKREKSPANVGAANGADMFGGQGFAIHPEPLN